MSTPAPQVVNLTQIPLRLGDSASNVLAGYDMIVQITQNEINSQFARLFGTVIQSEVTANGLSASLFGGSPNLSSYLRGYINAPEVALATQEQPLQTLFYFTFQPQTVTAQSLGVAQSVLDAAFTSSSDKVDGLVSKTEDIPYRDSQGNLQTLSGQKVGYWLTQTQTKIGSITTSQYSLVPSLMYYDAGLQSNVMVSLAGLKLSFQVMLDKIPTTAAQIQEQVTNGTAPQELLDTIKSKGFDSEAFSLEQLFLNFDSTDFTQWQLTDPAGGLGGQVNILALNNDGSYKSATLPLKQIESSDPQFSTELSVALQYAFGLSGKNTQGASPYIVGVTVSSNAPAQTDSMQPPSLVPTYISYSSTPNTSDSGLSALTYQVMGGDIGAARVPRNNDQTPINVSTNTVTNNNFSGELLYARSVFFEPLILLPTQQSINSSCNGTNLNWTQSGSTWSASYVTTLNPVNKTDTTIGFGQIQEVYQDYNNSYAITVTDGKIAVTANTSLTVRIEIAIVAFTGKIWFKWSKQGTLNSSSETDMSVDGQNNLQFTSSSNIPSPTIGDTKEDFGAELTDAVSSAFSTLSGGYMDPISSMMADIGKGIGNQLSSTAQALNQNITNAMKTKFISPTGKVFLINAPRYNGEYDLQMDVTYSV